MGLLRILLASLVLASHSRLAPAFTGSLAVECFFAISGFYIQMILREQYSEHKHWPVKFLASRFLRIFIPYWIILFCIILLSFGQYFFFGSNPLPPQLWQHPFDAQMASSWFANLFIFGSDYIKLWRTADGCNSFLWQQLIISPVWSVGIELTFYLCAPLVLMCRDRILLGFTIFCIAAKYILLHGRAYDVFRNLECADGLLNGIFPLELGVFLCGALGYRWYVRHLAGPARRYEYVGLLLLVMLATGLAIAALRVGPVGAMLGFQGYILVIILMLPFLFRASRHRRFDYRIGNLSYAFYLWHYYLLKRCELLDMSPRCTFLLAELLALGAAWIISYGIERPLDAYRHRHFRK